MRKGLSRTLTATFVGLGLTLGLAAPSYAAVKPRDTGIVRPMAVAPAVSALPSGQSTKTWTVQEYITAWEKTNRREMTASEKATLARGCIGVSTVNFERGNINPPLALSFGTLAQAKAVQAALNEILATKPTRAEYVAAVRKHPVLGKLKNVTTALPYTSAELTASIFSKRFYAKQNASWTVKQEESAYLPDTNGQVDMSSYRYKARPDYVNFDYGWYDAGTDNWWHANHAEPGMKIYQSTLAHYSRPLLDFNRQVFVVTFSKKSAWDALP